MSTAPFHIAGDLRVMGVVNVTPDSFSDGGRHMEPDSAFRFAEQLIKDGADIVDIGGESTRPSARPVDPEEQIRRTQPLILRLHQAYPSTAISIDTQSSAVAKAALEAGAVMVNDISALRGDPDMARLVASADCDLVLMHMQGTPWTMQQAPNYDDAPGEIEAFLRQRLACAKDSGIACERIIIDPGIGFGKTLQHNLQILAELRRFAAIAPVLLGISRKSFIGQILDLADPADRETGTVVANTIGLLNGASILRVHDVVKARQATAIVEALRSI